MNIKSRLGHLLSLSVLPFDGQRKWDSATFRSRESRDQTSTAPNPSEETLVDDLNFVFSHDSPLNTTIRGPGRVMLYRVWSDLAEPTVTKIVWNGTEESVSIIQWSSLRFHKVSLANVGPPRKVGQVLETGPIYNGFVKPAIGVVS